MAESGPDHQDRELRARLEKLSGALGEVRQQARDEKARDAAAMAGGRETGRAASLAFRMVSELIGGILVGVAIGWGLDKLMGTSPFLIIIFSLLGTAAGFWNVIRAASAPTPAGKDGEGG